MECQRMRAVMIEAVLGAASDVERQALIRHCSQCSACASAYRECLSTVGQAAEQASLAPASAQLKGRLRAAVHDELAAGRRPAWQPRLALAGGLVVLALAAGVALVRSLLPDHSAEVWSYAHGRALQATSLHAPVVCGDRLFALSGADSSAGVVAFDRRSGRQLWECALASYGYLAAGDGRVLCVTPGRAGGSGLAAMDASSGKLLWRYESGSDRGRAPGIPIAWDGRVLWSSGSALHQLDGASGACRWTRSLAPSAQNSQVALCGNRAFIVLGDTLVCLDADSGRERWQTALPGATLGFTPPLLAAAGGRLFVAERLIDGSSLVASVDTSAGTVLWKRSTAAVYHLAADNGIVIARSNVLTALNPTDGATAWTFSAEGCSPVSLLGRSVLVTRGGNEAALLTLDAGSGRVTRTLPLTQSCAGVVVSRGMWFVQANDGTLHALKAG